MQKMIFIILGLMLLFSFGCPGEEVPVEPPSEEEVPEDEEEPAPGPIEEPELPPEEIPEINESGEEAVPEEPEEEIPGEPVEEVVCVPIATSGYAEVGVYTEDAKYYYEGTELAYASQLKIGDSISLGEGGKITLEDIIINGTCDECGEKPSWTYGQMAKIRITVPHGDEEVKVVGVDEHGSFVSSYKCKTLDWDGKTCVEWVPDGGSQYYVWRVVADKICVEEKEGIEEEEA